MKECVLISYHYHTFWAAGKILVTNGIFPVVGSWGSTSTSVNGHYAFSSTNADAVAPYACSHGYKGFSCCLA